MKTRSDVPALKTKHSRGDIIKTRSDVSVVFHDDRRNVHVHTAVSIDTEKDWFALDSRFRSSIDSSDGCQIVAVPITTDKEINSRCPKVGRKRRPPTTVHVRNRATRNSVHHTQRHQFMTRLPAESSNSQRTFEKLHEGEN